MGPRRNSRTQLFAEGLESDIEYFFASDARFLAIFTENEASYSMKNLSFLINHLIMFLCYTYRNFFPKILTFWTSKNLKETDYQK